MSHTTIAAIATAPGRGGVAVIRVSGPDAFAVAERLTGWRPADAESFPRLKLCKIFPPVGADPRAARPPVGADHRAAREDARREIRDARGLETRDGNQTIKQSPNQTILDTALVLAFRAPHSYTGEDVVEFQCHGGTVTPARVLAACFAAGATAARRGEFTERAFLNGKIDLSEAESVIELVDAKTVRAADDALARQAGARKAAYRALYENALALSAELEHALDVDEGELPDDFLPSRAARAAALGAEARRLAGSADAGRLLRDGALVVLAGAPNAGKSSLLNALCREDRAIVSPTPGTTRDTIEAWIDLDGWPVRLVDTAGLRETGDAIEREGVRRAEELMKKADLILALDCRREICSRPRRRGIPSASPPTRLDVDRVIRLHAKCDLDSPRGCISPKCTLSVSAKTGEGLDALRAEIAARLAARAGAAAEDGATASERERALLLAAARQLEGEGERLKTRDANEDLRRETNRVSRLLSRALDPVLLANAVRAAAETIGALIGATYSSDLLDALFSRFCVGK